MYIIEEVFSIIYISIFNRKRSIWVDKVLIVKYIIDKYQCEVLYYSILGRDGYIEIYLLYIIIILYDKIYYN